MLLSSSSSFCFGKRGGAEGFREPAVNFGEQRLRLSSASLRFEPSREGCCRLQFVVLGALDTRALDRGSIGCVDRQSVGIALSEQVRAVSEDRRSNLSQLFRISESLTNKGETVFNLSLPDEKFSSSSLPT